MASTPNVYYMKNEKMARTSGSVFSEHHDKYFNNDLALIKEENHQKALDNKDKNWEIHVELQPMKKNGGKNPIGMESSTSSIFNQYFKDLGIIMNGCKV